MVAAGSTFKDLFGSGSGDKKEYYAGGEKSGLAIEKPDGPVIDSYANGFRLDGHFYSYDDPANVENWAVIRDGKVPLGLEKHFNAQQDSVAVRVRHLEHENFDARSDAGVRAAPAATGTAGGRQLGERPPTAASAPRAAPVTTQVSLEAPEARRRDSKYLLGVRDLQGQKHFISCSASETVQELYDKVAVATRAKHFQLASVHPKRVIPRSKNTLEDENLSGAFLMQTN